MKKLKNNYKKIGIDDFMKPEEIQIYKMNVGDKEYRGMIVPTAIKLKCNINEVKILYELYL